MTAPSPRLRARAFTLLEMMVATTIATLIAFLLVNIMGNVSRIWVRGNAKMSSLQGGRAIVDFISRDVRSIEPPKTATRVSIDAFAANSAASRLDPKPYAHLQFLIDAGAGPDGLDSYLPESRKSVPNSSNFFGQMRGTPTKNGDVWILGYYLADDDDGLRRLYRVSVAPDAVAANAANPVYKLFREVEGVQPGNPTANSWVYDARLFEDWDATARYGSSAIAEHVAAFWVEALDHAGKPVPWLSTGGTPNRDAASAPLKFDSAAHFHMPAGAAAFAAAKAGKPTFLYLDRTASSAGQAGTLSAHTLPCALRITLVITDDTYARRQKPLPDIPAQSEPGDAMEKAGEYRDLLYAAGQKQVGIFSATVEFTTKDGI